MTDAAISGFNEFLAAQQATLDDHGKDDDSTERAALEDEFGDTGFIDRPRESR